MPFKRKKELESLLKIQTMDDVWGFRILKLYTDDGLHCAKVLVNNIEVNFNCHDDISFVFLWLDPIEDPEIQMVLEHFIGNRGHGFFTFDTFICELRTVVELEIEEIDLEMAADMSLETEEE